MISTQFMAKVPCPFLTRLSTPYVRHHGRMLVNKYADACPVASRMMAHHWWALLPGKASRPVTNEYFLKINEH